MHIRQNGKGELFVRLMKTHNPDLVFHFSRHESAFFIRYEGRPKINKDKIELPEGKRQKLSTLVSGERLIDFLLSESVASRKPIEKVIHSIMLDITPSKFNHRLMVVSFFINPEKWRNLTNTKDYDAVVDTNFNKPLGVLVQPYFEEIHKNPDGWILL